jgi:uncharacterized protein YigA (DUF484 family)
MPETPEIPEELALAEVSAVAADAPAAPETAPVSGKMKEHAPMLDVHPAHHAANSWKDFFVHIATIVLGLLIAISLEQTVEYFHHRSEVAETREALRRERQSNVARFALEADDLARAVPIFQEDLAVFTYLRAHPGAARDHWPGKLEGQVITTIYLDSAWKTAQQSNVLQYVPQVEVESNDRLYLYLQMLNDMETAKFEQLYQLRKTLAVEPDAEKLSPAELNADIDRAVELLVICIKISNRQVNLNSYFPDFKASESNLTLQIPQILHWPAYDPGSDRAKDFAKLTERLRIISAADYGLTAPAAQETSPKQ